MILEVGRIVAIEQRGLWVETIQQSACNSCRAQKGCGHSLVAKFGASASRIWVMLDERDNSRYSLGDEVRIGVPEDVIARGALFIYMVPLLSMLAAVFIAHLQAMSEGASLMYAVVGLAFGASVVRWRSYQTRFDSRLQPVVVDNLQPLKLL